MKRKRLLAVVAGFGFFALLGLPLAGAAAPAADNCLACHIRLSDARLAKPAEDFASDVHTAKGFGCVACHGGDATIPGMGAMDPAKGFVGKPDHRQIPQLCGSCHSDARFMKRYNPALRVDQVTEYYTSVHGRRLKELGDPKVATCISCHSAHTILPPSDPRSKVYPLHVAETCGGCHSDTKLMAPYKIPTDQLEKYKKSVHWQVLSVQGDLSAPTCNDCHGNHGAAPPGISWVGKVCGQCHVVMDDLFERSIHAKVFTQMGSPGCATCHQNHEISAVSDEMVGLGDKAVCSACHSANDPGGKTALQIRSLIDSLRTANEEARTLLAQAGRAGMEVSRAQFELKGAQTALVKARTAVHAFQLEPVEKDVGEGLSISENAYIRGTRAMEELHFRRLGLAVSVLIILGLIVGLVLKIRQLERK